MHKFKILIMLFLAFGYGCKEIKTEEELESKFSIALGEFTTFEEASKFKSSVDFSLWRELTIKQTEENLFFLLYGNFESSFEAGMKGFELYQEYLLRNYKIFFEENYTADNFANVLFVAKYQGRPSVYSYNLIKNKAALLWSRWGRKVVSLNHSDDRNSVFITTALGYGVRGGFPYITDARLYKYSSVLNRVDEIDVFGNGLQIYTYWETSDTFKVNFTKPDSIHSDIMVQKIYSYDIEGFPAVQLKRDFNLIKEGFPKPPAVQNPFFSPNNSFGIREVIENGINYLYIRDLKNSSEILLTDYKGKLNKVLWSDNEDFLFMILEQHGSLDKQQKLMVVDTKEKKSKRIFQGIGSNNLLLNGNLLFFDRQIQGVSQINIYDIKTDSIYSKIQIEGGCALNKLPQ